MEILNWLNLQLMAEGGEAASGEATSQDTAGNEVQEAVPAEPEDLEAEFDKLVKGDGKFRQVYGKRQQKTAMERTKGMKATVDKYNAWSPAFEVLGARYGLNPDDPQLIQKIAGDQSLLEDLALKNGSSTDAEMQIARAKAAEERANKAYQNMMAEKDMQRWQAQADELKSKYPGFDLNEELDNREFVQLLKLGVDMQAAYMALHHNEIEQQIVRRAEKRVTDTVAAGKARPRENGVGSQAGAAMTADPSKMSSSEFKEYMKRVERGERISFSK